MKYGIFCAVRWLAGAAIAGVGLSALAGCESGGGEPAASAPTDTCKNAKSGDICTVLGDGHQGFDGDGNAPLESWLYWPVDLAFDGKDTLTVLDWNNHRIRRVVGGKAETIMGTDKPGDGDPGKLDLTVGAPGTTIDLNHPSDIFYADRDTSLYKKGQLIVAAWHNHRLRSWDPATKLVLTILGTTPGYFGDGAKADKTTKVNQPSKIHQDSKGNLYIIDMRNWRVRMVGTDGVIKTIAANGKPAAVADDGPAKALESSFLFFDPAEFGNPFSAGGGLATNADASKLYVADSENHRIRELDLATGMMQTIAGSGESGCIEGGAAGACVNDGIAHPTVGQFAGDGGDAKKARLNRPHDLALGPDGRLYFADTGNHRIRAIDLKSNVITTVAGGGAAPKNIKPLAAADLGDGKAATAARLHTPKGIAFDSAGNLYIADTYNHRIRRVIK
jgi:sugar lactone lactonase YvrE